MSFVARHSLLRRQLRKIFGTEAIPSDLAPLLSTIDEAYRQFDEDRVMLERTLDLSSEELLAANAELRDSQDVLERTVRDRTAELVTANETLLEEIAERKEAEDRRRRLEVKLLQTQKLESLGVLTGGIAHDFNNLLMAILGNAALAMDEVGLDSPARVRLREIESASNRAADLTSQMLAYSGKGTFKIEPVEISEVTEEMASLLEVSITKKASLIYEMEAGIPPVRADSAQIGQVVMNLITNASDALGDAGGTVTLRTGLLEADTAYLAACVLGDEIREGPYVFLEVTDDGEGMDAPTVERVFDPFFTTKFTGRGLGLASVLGIVRSHKGAIRVSSAPKMGTRFTVLLPVADDETVARERDDGAADAESEHEPNLGTVLLVDDDRAVRAVLADALGWAGYLVIEAGNGRAGVDAFAAHQEAIVCVVLDMAMPVMDGPEAYREIRAISQDVHVVFISGYEARRAAEAVGTGPNLDFLRKPFVPKSLLARIRRAAVGG